MKTYESAAQIESFHDDIETLSKFLVLDVVGHTERFHAESLSLRKSAWIASLLASSTNESHQKLAIDFAILAFHFSNEREEMNEAVFKNLLYVVAARTGNLPTLTYFDESLDQLEEETISGADGLLSLELFGERDVYITERGETLSKFQNDIWSGFQENVDIAISGPTSSGKSHIVKNFLNTNLADKRDFEAVYIVPTRALITENSTTLRGIIRDLELNNDVRVMTGGTQENSEESVIYVLTPERCLNLLENEYFVPDIIFIDEIQNIGDDNRGVLYEIINSKLSEKWNDARMVAAGPFLENSKELLDDATGRDSEGISTEVAPVLQLRTGLTFTRDNGLKIKIFTPSQRIVTIDADFLEHRTWNQAKNMKKTVPTILKPFSRGNKNLIYCHKSNLAEQWAQEIASNKEQVELSEEAEQIIQFLEDRIHPHYPLIECLRHGVAFHHGKVPELARNAVESMYENDAFLETIVSTPTLLQGVNLPCQEIFILKPNKGNKNLGDFDFQNLIGRVGRLSENLFGIVYGVEREGEEWIDEHMENTENESITPATDKATSEEKETLLEKVGDQNLRVDEKPAVRYTIILLRHKYLRNKVSFREYLKDKEFTQEEISYVESQFTGLLDLNIPNNIVFKNPSVDPVKQDELYTQVFANLDDWNFDPRWVSENVFKNRCRKLNTVFEFCVDHPTGVYFANHRDTETHLTFIGYIAEYAYLWINGKSYREIIEKRIENAPRSEKQSTSIRKAIKTINDDTRFVLVKYFKILGDVLNYLIEEKLVDEDEVYPHLLDIDTILERGSSNFTEINAMNAGLSRTMATELDLPENQDPMEFLRENPDQLTEIERISLRNKNLM